MYGLIIICVGIVQEMVIDNSAAKTQEKECERFILGITLTAETSIDAAYHKILMYCAFMSIIILRNVVQ